MTAAAPEPLERLGLLFDRAVRTLGDVGETDAAARLAAEAWWLLREPSPGCARRLNATLHYLTLKPSKEKPCPPAPTRSSTSGRSRRPAGTS